MKIMMFKNSVLPPKKNVTPETTAINQQTVKEEKLPHFGKQTDNSWEYCEIWG